ncbi:single-stranded-DNA-specific exonuclease RecJ [Candidatus Poribacteria bacterium]|nr:single-stranded-DNA-specific exonuclease RecJ [Candidatus Poribacteria bacterium]
MDRRVWHAAPYDIPAVAALSVDAGVTPFVAHLLLNRGIASVAETRAFIHPTFDDIHDPWSLPDMEPAVECLRRAIGDGSRITIYGDYDVDGTTATAILLRVFRALGANVDHYIPERAREGYGLNTDAIHAIHASGTRVLVTVDCGVTAQGPIESAHELGIDVIVTDHHSPDEDRLPREGTAVAVIDPKLPGSTYPFEELAGVGLAFKLAHALVGGSLDADRNPLLLDQLGMVALGTIADMAQMRGENRALAKLGLEVLNRRNSPGIRALCEVAGIKPETTLTGRHVGWQLGPRINAAGRLDSARKVVRLLITDSDMEAQEIARELHADNEERRRLTERIFQDACAQVDSDRAALERERALFLCRDGWHPGVVGIVAGRLVERYGMPTVLVGMEEDIGKGSARSIPEFDIHDALLECRELMVTFGGHRAAAGLTVTRDRARSLGRRFLAVARERLSETDIAPKLRLDSVIPLSELTIEAIRETAALDPFSEGNPQPRVGIRGLRVQGAPRLFGKESTHLGVTLVDEPYSIRAIRWRHTEDAVALSASGVEVDVAGVVEIDEYGNTSRPQISVDHWSVRPAGSTGIYPPHETAAWVRIEDRRRETSKADALADVLLRGEPSLVYVRDARAAEQARELLDGMGVSCGEDEAGAQQLIAGDVTALLTSEAVDHAVPPSDWALIHQIVLCHAPSDDPAFCALCEPLLMRWVGAPDLETASGRIVLLFNERDIVADARQVEADHPSEETLREAFRVHRTVAARVGGAVALADWSVESGLDPGTVQRVADVLVEIGVLSRHEGDTPSFARIEAATGSLDDSATFREFRIARLRQRLRGERWLRATPRDFWEVLDRHRRTMRRSGTG